MFKGKSLKQFVLQRASLIIIAVAIIVIVANILEKFAIFSGLMK